MIPKKFHLFWHKGPISFLRYITFYTLRHHHPDWEVNLYYSNEYKATTWKEEDQDFLGDCKIDFTDRVLDLVDNVRTYNNHPDVAPNFQSDFFRWDILWDEGGFYIDSDQIILKSFNPLCEFDFIGARYQGYTPVGVVGSSPCNPIVGKCKEVISSKYNPKDYNCIGPYMFRDVLSSIEGLDWYKEQKVFITPSNLFYPIPYSPDARKIYDGSFLPSPDVSFACHWFGGHPESQKFNRNYGPDQVKTSNDSISQYIRSLDQSF